MVFTAPAAFADPARADQAKADQAPAYSIFHPNPGVSSPVPDSVSDKVYTQPSQAPAIAPDDIMSPAYFDAQGETPVGHKIDAMQSELNDLQTKVGRFAGILSGIESGASE